ncbi:adenylate cyclase [Diplogelasinospora grovesii]|uniref:Adenylate cyclase n=1 Tax=Diplogelasinospora grovesii TaxID=303347 RepID=A0AAN6NAG9_9PEZI|nr:adenylate cyclase [Diplogelasinospora grovesii]
MTRHDAGSRFSSMTGSSTDSARSSITVKPLPATPTTATSAGSSSNNTNSNGSSNGTSTDRSASHGSRRAAPSRLKTDENGNLMRTVKELESISPTSQSASRLALSPSSTASSNISLREHRMSDLAGYRRDLAILDPGGGSRTAPSNQGNPASGSLSQVAPWMMAINNGGGASTPSSIGGNTGAGGIPTTFYDDSSDNLSLGSQLSPSFRSASTAYPTQTPAGSTDSPDVAYFTDERRPSIASITTTASSQGSKASGNRGGFRKLQGFFGEEFPGRDSSETSLTQPAAGKEQRSHSYSHGRPHRDRNYSNATDHTRDGSPSSSRPRTPVPAPEVVPFLYQEADDIARYGEAPVRDILTGPDRERYVTDSQSQNPPKTSSSSRSGHSLVHLPGHHRHNKSNEDPRALRPSISREDSVGSISAKDRNGSSTVYSGSTYSGSTTLYGPRSRAQSPTPSGNFVAVAKNGMAEGSTSPGHGQHHKKGLLGRLRGRHHKDKDDGSGALKKLPASSQSLQHRPSKTDLSRGEGLPPQAASEWPSPSLDFRDAYGRPGYAKQATFNNKFPFSKKARSHRLHEDIDENIGPTDRTDGGTVFHLDTNLNDMEGILSRPPPLTPMDADFLQKIEPEKLPIMPTGPNPLHKWFAPDSWAVRQTEEAADPPAAGLDDIGSPPGPEEKLTQYCIRVFKQDGSFSTVSLPLEATVQELLNSLFKKSYINDKVDNWHIVLKKQDALRILGHGERPLLLQKRLLQQIGYQEKDRIEDIGREDNSYLCRFLFLSAKESDLMAVTDDINLDRLHKHNHIDLSRRNLITIPVPLYSKGPDIISLNLSRNLSLILPRDFIQLCQNLRDIKYCYNEARKLPPSLSRASKLTFLDVSNNRLEQLEHAELNRLTSLLKLNLANNRLKHLPSSFSAFNALRTLNISSNYLEQFPSFICDLESLVDLDLSFNLIGVFPDGMGRLRNLEKFVITNNRLGGVLPDSFKKLSSLRELDIKFNGITGIDVISELPKLEILAADHNAIVQFTGTFERIRSLKLNSNPITKFEIKAPVPTLKVLNLSHTQLANIDKSFSKMTSLERLVLDKNYFVSLPAQIGLLKRLEHFSISNNSVGELPPEVGCLTELRVLDVRGNNLRRLPMELWWANRLETLNASSNVLDNFPKPASRPPQPPGEASSTSSPLSTKTGQTESLSQTPSSEELSGDASRRPSQASSTLLSVGPSPVPPGPDRKSSLVSVYGKGGRKTSVVSRSTTASSTTGMATPTSASRKDSGLSQRLTNTFAGSLRHLYLADNQLDDEVFDQLTLLSEFRVLNLSYNEISDMPQRSIKSWPQLVELYLSGNELTSLPADDLEEYSLLQVLHINGNKFTNLPADISRAKKLAVLDCGSNYLKYNINNVPYDWNWNLNPNLRYLNLSGNRRLEIKQSFPGGATHNRDHQQYTDFNRLHNLRVLGLMDVTLMQPNIPDQSEDRRVRTSGSMAGYLPYGMADTLGKYEHLSTMDLVVPRFNASETETLLGLFDGQVAMLGGSKIAMYLHENLGRLLTQELRALNLKRGDTPEDALRRAFLTLNKDLVTVARANSTSEKGSHSAPRGSHANVAFLTKEDLCLGGVATVVYLQNMELFVANVGDAQAMLIQSDGTHRMLTKKHDPADPHERHRIREAGGWVSRNGKLNDVLWVSRAFGYEALMPVVSAAPHTCHISLKEGDETVLIATKELWEYVSPGLVVDIARTERGDLMRAAQKLRDLAMAYGSSSKIMVMVISVADLKRRMDRSRQHKIGGGGSVSFLSSSAQEDSALMVPRRPRKTKGEGPLDSTLQRLEAEVPAPKGLISIVFTDIKNSTKLWETYPEAMRSAIKVHNDVMRRQLRRIGGFEVKTEGDAFMVSFPTATSALLWCFAVQTHLLTAPWPSEILNSVHCQPTFDRDNKLIFKGLSVRMGIHWGEPLAELDPVTRRMDYYGPMVNRTSRISSCADGGQIAVSADFIMEIQRCLETYQDTSNQSDVDGFDVMEDGYAKAIRNDLRNLSSQGFEVKDMGEKKLKGLENPEFVYSVYPNSLTGRVEHHNAYERAQQNAAGGSANAMMATGGGWVPGAENEDARPALVLEPGSSELAGFDPDLVWSLWRVGLRLEAINSTLEDATSSTRGLQAPETTILERMKQGGGEVSEAFIMRFMEHLVTRIEACVNTLSMRHLAIGGGEISHLHDLRAPASAVLDSVAAQLAELKRYKALYGELKDGSGTEQE